MLDPVFSIYDAIAYEGKSANLTLSDWLWRNSLTYGVRQIVVFYVPLILFLCVMWQGVSLRGRGLTVGSASGIDSMDADSLDSNDDDYKRLADVNVPDHIKRMLPDEF